MGPQRVEEAHQRVAEILTLTVGGRQIQTTTEHPFWVKDRGWVEACDLAAGDELSTSSGEWVTIENVTSDGTVTTVYNMTVELWHTYFVGTPTWGFDIWVHNNHNLNFKNALAEAIENGDLRVTNKVGAGAARTPRHHVFPQEQRAWFKARGIEIDNYTLPLNQGIHEAVHY